MKTNYRIGPIFPGSNVAMGTEIPAMLRAREAIRPERFTFHSNRMRLRTGTVGELAAMNADSQCCARELADAEVDGMGYACPVAIMAQGLGYHRVSRRNLDAVVAQEGRDIPDVSSAGALVGGAREMGAKRVSLLRPDMKPLAARVTNYIVSEGSGVLDSFAPEIADNLEVG